MVESRLQIFCLELIQWATKQFVNICYSVKCFFMISLTNVRIFACSNMISRYSLREVSWGPAFMITLGHYSFALDWRTLVKVLVRVRTFYWAVSWFLLELFYEDDPYPGLMLWFSTRSRFTTTVLKHCLPAFFKLPIEIWFWRVQSLPFWVLFFFEISTRVTTLKL